MHFMLKLFKNFIKKIVHQEIDGRLFNVVSVEPPQGYNPIEKIRGGLYHWVLIPFNGVPVWCKLRCLNQTQQEACGAVTLIERMVEIGQKKSFSMSDRIEIRNRQEAIAKAIMIKPSFDEILKLVGEEDLIYSSAKNEIEELKKINIKDLPPEARPEFEERLFKLELSTAYILPEDAFGVLTNWALGIDISDIKKVTEDQLYNAAILAKRGNDNPSDHVFGLFTLNDEIDIDSSAWDVFDKR